LTKNEHLEKFFKHRSPSTGRDPILFQSKTLDSKHETVEKIHVPENEVSEEVNVVQIDTKKQRINDNYIELDSNLVNEPLSYDSEYGLEDEEDHDDIIGNMLLRTFLTSAES
jgi:hypothetical protein